MNNSKPTLVGQGVTDSPKPILPRFNVRFGAGKATSYDPAVLTQPEWDDLRDLCVASLEKIGITIIQLPRWPDEPRYAFLSLLRQITDNVRVRVYDAWYTDPFEAVLAAMTANATLPEMQQMQRAAIEAAALFYPDAPEFAAARINQRLSEVSQPKINYLHLVKKIRQVTGDIEDPKSLDSRQAAEHYLAYLREQAELAEEEPVFRYYQDDFYLWRGKVWQRLEDAQVDAMVTKQLQSFDLPKLSKRFIGDVVANLKGLALLDCWSESKPFMVVHETPLQITRPPLIVFANGALDVDAALAAEDLPDPIEIDSRFFNDIALPYEYDPLATCPLWEQTLNDILPETTDKNGRRQVLLQEFMGYTLLSSCRYQKFLVLIGPGGNGKSVVTETWEAMLGDANVTDIRLDELCGEFRAAALDGKLANFSGEIPYLGKINEALLKRLVSGEAIDVNRKHKSPIRLRTTVKLIVNTNTLPSFADPTRATWDRLIMMPFNVRIRGTCKEDKNRIDKLKAELPGIFNWALRGLKRLLKQGKFTDCKECNAMTQQHRTESDSVLQFIAECCTADELYQTLSGPLYQLYKVWARETGRKEVQQGEFGKRLQRQGWPKKRLSGGARPYVYVGVRTSLDAEPHIKVWQRIHYTDQPISYHKAGPPPAAV